MGPVPSMIDIDGNRFSMKIVPKGDWPNPDLMGQIEYAALQIRVPEGMPPDVTRDTVLHEAIHGVFKSRIPEIGWNELVGKNSKKTSEMVVDTLASGFLQLMRRNPDLVKWLMENE